MSLDVLLVGSGGREHALAWKMMQSSRLGKLYSAPGNAGTAALGENVAIGVMEFGKLADFALEKKVGLIVVAPDDPLAAGAVDYFESRDLRAWGASKAGAQLEASKAFSKQVMQEAGIPTAQFEVFTEHAEALAYVQEKGAPIVVKASGLALGKGAYVCMTMQEAEAALDEIMVQKLHKEAGDEVVIEEYLEGPEISIHALCDGADYVMLPSSQDHKRALDGDRGKNTGGMGTIAPLPWVTDAQMKEIEEKIVRPTLDAMKKRGTPFKGLLYPGLMMTQSGPKVLEYNARFGDPETQVYMRLLKSDILDLFDACIDGTLAQQHIEWNQGYAVNIVLASGGYPDAYKKGLPITGIQEAAAMPDIVVFHAGTKRENMDTACPYLTNGGRVLGVSAIGDTLKDALDKAYAAADKIQFEGKQLRRDIGGKSIS
jgi:phosphoribosylamine--glycine ligase